MRPVCTWGLGGDLVSLFEIKMTITELQIVTKVTTAAYIPSKIKYEAHVVH